MERKEAKPAKRMSDYGYKGIMVYLLEKEYEAMREYCFKKRLKHSTFVRSLVVSELKKEGMLKE